MEDGRFVFAPSDLAAADALAVLRLGLFGAADAAAEPRRSAAAAFTLAARASPKPGTALISEIEAFARSSTVLIPCFARSFALLGPSPLTSLRFVLMD